MPWTAEDEEEFGTPVPMRGNMVLPEVHIVGDVDPDADADLDATSVWSDLYDATRPNPDVHAGGAAASRLGRRASRTLSEIVDDPGAALSGAADALSLGWADELTGASRAHPLASALLGQIPTTVYEGFAQSPEYTHARDEIRQYDDDAEANSPGAHMVGEVAGTLLPAIATGGVSAEAEAPGFLATIGRGAGIGAGVGALGGAGSSDATGADLAEDTALSALAGGVTGGLVSGVPAVSRSLRGRAGAAQEAADLARVGSVGGGRGTIARTDPRIAEFARLPGGIAGQAERIRRLGLVGPVDSIQRTAERSREVLDRLLSDGAMTGTRQRIAESGAEVPVSTIVDALEGEARGAEGMAATRPYAQHARDLGQRFRDAYGSAEATTIGAGRDGSYRVAPEQVQDLEATLPYSRAVEELGALDGEIPWTSERLAADAARGRRRAIRDALDEWIEGQVGPEEAGRYREGRLDYQTARVAADQARDRAAASAGGRGVSLTDTIAASGAQSPLSAAARLLFNRGWRMHEPAARATYAETLARLLGSLPEGGASPEVESIAGRLSPELQQRLRDALRPPTSSDGDAGADPFASLGAVLDEEAPTEAAPDETDPFAALGAVPDDEEEE